MKRLTDDEFDEKSLADERSAWKVIFERFVDFHCR